MTKLDNQKYITETMKLMQNHRSIRKFTKDQIPKEQIVEIVKAAQGAATSHFVQAYSLVMVTDPIKKEQLSALSNHQQQIIDAPLFFVFCADMKRLEFAARKHDIPMQYDTLENFIVSIVDTSLFAENFLTAAESLGYGGCYIGGIRNNPKQVSELLNLPDKVMPIFGMTLGVPAENHEVKPRLPIEAILHENGYNTENYQQLLDQFDVTFREYYKTRTSNAKDMTWTQTMATFFSEKKRTHMKEFVETKGFHLY